MNNKKLALILVALVILGELLLGRTTADVYPDPGYKTNWEGKVLVVTTKLNQHTAYLENGSIRRLGDQWFLVGRQMEIDKQTWTEGKITWIVLSDVASLVEVSGTEEMRRIFAQFPAR